MLENEYDSNYNELEQSHYESNDNEYNKNIVEQKKWFLCYLLMDSLVKLGGAMHELVILNILRENFFYNLSRGDILNIVFRSYLILALIFIDRYCLDNISDCKQQLSILKENNAKLKKLASTKKHIG